MKLKKEVSLSDFMRTVRQCRGEICFKTLEGDMLNLRSTLSAYLFMATASDNARSCLSDGEITCADAADKLLLAPFCLSEDK